MAFIPASYLTQKQAPFRASIPADEHIELTLTIADFERVIDGLELAGQKAAERDLMVSCESYYSLRNCLIKRWFSETRNFITHTDEAAE